MRMNIPAISLSMLAMLRVARAVRSRTTAFAIQQSRRTDISFSFSRLKSPRPPLSLALYSTVDDSAMSKSRAPFQMPKGAPDDSVPQDQGKELAWNQLGLFSELVEAMAEQGLEQPTPVQQLVIPDLLKEPPQNMAFLAATGSGKTLAYALPLLQQLKQTELFESVDRRPKRPRLLILAPTRELVLQIKQVVKSLCHNIKLSSGYVLGGEDYGLQRKRLDRNLDILVATPGRLLKHWKDQNVYLGSLEHIVLDEMDTMLEQGFAKELKQLLYPILYHKQAQQTIDLAIDLNPQEKKAPRLILTSATMTQAIQKIIGDNKNDGTVHAKRHYRKLDLAESAPKAAAITLPPCQVVKAKGLHKAVPRLRQVFVDVGAADKLSLLIDILSTGGSGAAMAMKDRRIHNDKDTTTALTMVFCNTASSCRAVQFALAEARMETLAYHGELNSAVRSDNLQRFRQAGQQQDNSDNDQVQPRVLVCTDLAARGLDVPQVDHVIMFDFPLNALDYLHRSGRTARGIQNDRQGNGRVTALVSKRDKVLANAIEQAVTRGEPLDGLSSRKSDYLPGGRLNSGSSGHRRNTASRSNSGRPKRGRQQAKQTYSSGNRRKGRR